MKFRDDPGGPHNYSHLGTCESALYWVHFLHQWAVALQGIRQQVFPWPTRRCWIFIQGSSACKSLALHTWPSGLKRLKTIDSTLVIPSCLKVRIRRVQFQISGLKDRGCRGVEEVSQEIYPLLDIYKIKLKCMVALPLNASMISVTQVKQSLCVVLGMHTKDINLFNSLYY